MTNKEIVMKFYEEVFNNWDISNLDTYMRDDYMQHSLGVADGKEGFLEFIEPFMAKKPHADIIKIIEEDDIVCIFFRCSFADGTIAKVFDMYRLQEGQLAEHWDCTARVDNVEAKSGRGHF